MPKPSGETRDLQFPYDRSLVPSAETPNDTIQNFPFTWPSLDSDEVVSVTLQLSLNEYIALSSCIDVGDDIAYGDNAILLWWIWVRSLQTMDICEQIADCVDTNVLVQNSINNMVVNFGDVNPNTSTPTLPEIVYRFPESEREQPFNDEVFECDFDVYWAGIVEVVTRIDQMGRDYYEQIVANVDKVERIIAVVDLVPLFGDTIADAVRIFSDAAPDLLNAYNAHSSQIVLEEMACKLFEICCVECRYPTFDEVYLLYSTFGITGIQDITAYGVQAAIDYLIGSDGLANSVVWYTTQSIALFILYMGGNWMGYRGTKWLRIWADIGEDAPNNGWELLCDGCPDPPYEIFFDFSTDSAVPPNSMNAGSWVTNAFWQGSNLANERLVYFSIPFGSGMLHNEVEIKYHITGANEGNASQNIFIQGALNATYLPFAVGQIMTEAFPIADLAGSLVKCVATNNRLTYSNNIYVYTLRFKGHGYVPAPLVPYMVSGVPA